VSVENVRLARRGFELALKGDLTALGEVLDPAVRWHGGDPGADGACNGRGQVLTWIGRAIERGAVGELVDVLDAGERVVVVMRPRRDGRLSDELVANVSTFRDGRVVEMVHHPSVEAARRLVGIDGP
jgi:ketosteroid isomerase-like protein